MKLLSSLIFLITFFTANSSFSKEREPELLPATKETLDSLIAASKGKVLLFNFWAYWCAPCKEEFPDLIKLRENYKERGLEVVFVTLDFGDALAEKTKPFLETMNVDWPTLYNGFKKDEDLINYMIPQGWDGAIPATFIYDKEGRQAVYFIGKKSYEDFAAEVEKLLN